MPSQASEQGSAYFNRMSKLARQQDATLAFRGGGAYLGIRQTEHTPKPTLRAGHVHHVPKTWTEDDLRQRLEGAGCADVAILRTGGMRQAWILKLVHPEALVGDLTKIQVGDTTLHLTRARARGRIHSGTSTPILSRQRQNKQGSATSTANPVPVSTQRPALRSLP